MISWPLPIGTVVRGASCIGQPFEAEIIGYRGTLTPILSDGYVTPARLINEVVRLGAGPPPADDGGFLPEGPGVESAPASDQLRLF